MTYTIFECSEWSWHICLRMTQSDFASLVVESKQNNYSCFNFAGQLIDEIIVLKNSNKKGEKMQMSNNCNSCTKSFKIDPSNLVWCWPWSPSTTNNLTSLSLREPIYLHSSWAPLLLNVPYLTCFILCACR